METSPPVTLHNGATAVSLPGGTQAHPPQASGNLGSVLLGSGVSCPALPCHEAGALISPTTTVPRPSEHRQK